MKYAIFLSLILFYSNFRLFSQTSDMDLIKQHYKTSTSSRSVNFGITESKNVLLKYNPISLGLGGLMFMYQKFIAQQTSSNCPYSPTCSEYGRQLIKKYGIIKGIPCAADRLMRCNPSTASRLRWKKDPTDRRIHEKLEYYQFKVNEIY